jgi:hypothetical protein
MTTATNEVKVTNHRPEFLGLGAQKAATSWIHACLSEHPQVFMPGRKELHFFSRHFERGGTWYETQFAAAEPGQVAGEISPTYLYDIPSPHRIQQWNPQMRLFACLRDPVERAISAYKYGVKMGQVPSDKRFSEALAEDPAYVEHGFYSTQVARYLSLFPRDQFLFTVYEDIRDDPVAFMQTIYRFIGVSPSFRPPSASRRVNESLGPPRSLALDRLLRGAAERLRELGLDQTVAKVARSSAGEWLTRRNRRPAPRVSEITAGERALLKDRFKDEVRSLSHLLSRDLRSVWMKDE